MTVRHKNYKEESDLLNYLVEPHSEPKFVFPDTISDEYIKELNENSLRLKTGCGCNSYTIDKDRNQITFTVKAPDVPFTCTTHYLKAVQAVFTSELGNRIIWDIKFYVRNKNIKE